MKATKERYKMSMSYSEAATFIKSFGEVKGDLLEGCEKMQMMIDAAMERDHATFGDDSYEGWAEIWSYEIEAFNTIVGGMRKLFGE